MQEEGEKEGQQRQQQHGRMVLASMDEDRGQTDNMLCGGMQQLHATPTVCCYHGPYCVHHTLSGMLCCFGPQGMSTRGCRGPGVTHSAACGGASQGGAGAGRLRHVVFIQQSISCTLRQCMNRVPGSQQDLLLAHVPGGSAGPHTRFRIAQRHLYIGQLATQDIRGPTGLVLTGLLQFLVGMGTGNQQGLQLAGP